MTTVRRVLIAMLGVVLVASVVGEHLARRLMERRYQKVVEGRQQLERQFREILATHRQLTGDLANERQRSQALSQAVAEKSAQLDKAVARLSEEGQAMRALQLRLAAMEQQMGQLQGELAAALQDRLTGATAKDAVPSAVQLERIVVSKAGAPTLQGRVVSVHQDWDFVIIDLGWDAVKIGDTVSIFRNEELLAKARVERVQEGVSAASVLPEWDIAKVRASDRVQL